MRVHFGTIGFLAIIGVMIGFLWVSAVAGHLFFGAGLLIASGGLGRLFQDHGPGRMRMIWTIELVLGVMALAISFTFAHSGI